MNYVKFLIVITFIIFGLTLAEQSFAATFTVTKIADTNDGSCNADCSLREAIVAANAAATDDVINFDATVFAGAQTIILTGGEISIINQGNLVINGTGASLLVVTSNLQSRIFSIGAGTSQTNTITINNLTIAAGSGSSAGGCIHKSSVTLTINNSVVRDCTSIAGGGGILSDLGTLIINNSTFSGNHGVSGGGIFAGGDLVMTNSTVSGNTAEMLGGGIRNFGNATLTNVTVAFNTATEAGGGIDNFFNGATTNLKNSIVAQNTSPGTGPDFNHTLTSQGYNLIGNASGATIVGNTTGNIIGQNPMLGALQDNGGGISTRALLSGSPAIDTADPANFPPTDQRGVPRPLDGDANGTSLPDIGAFEAGAKVVTKTADTNDGICDADCSLREAIAAANATTANDVILFASLFSTSSQTITLNGTELSISNNGTLTILGPGSNLLTVFANNLSRVFSVSAGANASISGLRITGGNRPGGQGAGIYNAGTLTLNNAVVSNNTSATNNGGGMFNDGAASSLTLNNAQIINNTGNGGGLYNFNGTMSINNSSVNNNTGINGTGILNVNGPLNLNATQIIGNTAGGGGGIGGGILNSGGTVTGTNTTISNNSGTTSGGGIQNNNNGSVTLTNSTVAFNSLSNGGGVGIQNSPGTINLTNVTLNNNTSTTGAGGAISSWGNTSLVTLNGVTINNNSASAGGGIFIENSSTLNVSNSAFFNNVGINGGGALIIGSGTATFSNTTVSANSATVAFSGGGGIQVGSGILNLFNSTVANNTSGSNGGAGVRNGNGTATGTINLRNTIIADNTSSGSTAHDVFGNFNSQGYNLIENTTGATIGGTATGNILGQDPQLAPLRNNGGSTNTIALQPTSPAVDSGDLNNFPATDQRGIARPQDGDLNGTQIPDIGAYERQIFTLTVSKTGDSNDGVCNTDCSLREAIAATNTGTTPDNVILFNPAIFSTVRTITLGSVGELPITHGGTLVISGPGASLLTISGNNLRRVFFTGPGANVIISNLRISGGNGSGAVQTGFGGGVLNTGNVLTLNNLIITGNSAQNGGGIRNNGSTLNIANSNISSNSASGDGGGIMNITPSVLNISSSLISGNTASSGAAIYNFGILTAVNLTASNNTSTLFGGGILNDGLFFGTATFTNSTISNNAANEGGGIANFNGTVVARNTLVADNTATTSSPDFRGNLNSQGYNLIENTSGATITGTTTGNVLGQDPMLGPLINNGGPTLTRALLGRSPAVDAGDPTVFPATDQRGSARPRDGDANGTVRSDIGAYERFAFGSTPFDFDGDRKTDISIFRPSLGEWWWLRSSDGGNGAVQFGTGTDKMTPADFTGDRKTDVAFWRPSTGEWFVLRSEDYSFYSFPFGTTGDIPATGDFDGDGKSDAAIFRPTTATWFIFNSGGGVTIQQFGANGDVPVVADYDGDGKSDIAIFRPSLGEWWMQRSNLGLLAVQFGASTDKPVQGDYTGDGKSDVAFWRPSTGEWFVLRSEDMSYFSFPFGTNGDVPAPGDYDGDGKFDATVFRPSTSTWYSQRTTAGTLIQTFGLSGDVPVPSAFVPEIP